MILDINVTQEDIKSGIRHDCYDCPVARATRRALEKTIHGLLDITVMTTSREIAIYGPGYPSKRIDEAKTPDAAAAFMRAFDSKKPPTLPLIKPFAFELDFPKL